MKKIVFITLTLALLASALYSQKVSKDEALRVGLNFYKHSAKELNLTKSNHNVSKYYTLETATNSEAIHVFNFEEGGFVIVSGNMSATPILGYSHEDNFIVEQVNPAAEAWINDYLSQIEYLETQNYEPTVETLSLWKDYAKNDFSQIKSTAEAGVDPLIKTKWDQGMYYNYFCPEHPAADASYDGKVVTGCVATAMAQVLNYYRYPSVGDGKIYYFWGENLSIDLSKETYDWSKELPEKLTPSIVRADSSLMFSVAKLMFHVGVAVHMDYGPTGSSSTLEYVPSVVRNNFRFRNGAEIRYLSEFTNDAEWRFLLRNELNLRRPVLYRGNDPGGHAFICDGWQGDLYFHFNWGWSGANDGYFYVGNLTPTNNMLYPQMQGAVFNAAPGGQTGTGYKYCMPNTVIPFPEGSFGDGSVDNNYFGDTDCQWLLTVEDADTAITNNFDSLKLFFTRFDVRAGDELIIYDGDNTESPVFFKYDGINPTIIYGEPNEDYKPIGSKPIKNLTTCSASKNLYFHFNTQPGGITADGWEIMFNTELKSKSPLSVDDNTLSNLTIYPNPTTNELNISGIEEKSEVQIYDIYGKLLVDINNFQNNSIDVSSLSGGIYFVKVNTKNGTRTMKIVKQ
ncbi:C10 family peptidase [Bacteroidales bacterium OttesenSCG-928-I21]|nr:C10 family peptidase [Bacteroidales bacterium OttesenSCG-928-I21]